VLSQLSFRNEWALQSQAFIKRYIFKTQQSGQPIECAIQPETGIFSMYDVEHISIYIHRSPADVYAYASNPQNLPLWAAGLARSEVTKQGDAWVAEAPFGKVKITFAQANKFGVLDHDVELESGVVVHNPMRVVPNGEGSEFMFTLLRQPGMSNEQFAADAQAVTEDLRALKTLLEAVP
jgi:hypothetical protein